MMNLDHLLSTRVHTKIDSDIMHSRVRNVRCTQALPHWMQKHVRPMEDPAVIKREVLGLAAWCKAHHSNTLITYPFDRSVCDDSKKHGKMFAILKRIKRLESGQHCGEYAEVWAIMDKDFGRRWRRGQGGTQRGTPWRYRLDSLAIEAPECF